MAKTKTAKSAVKKTAKPAHETKGLKKAVRSPKQAKPTDTIGNGAPPVEVAPADARPAVENPTHRAQTKPTPKNTKAARSKPSEKPGSAPTKPAAPSARLGVLSAAHQILLASSTPMTAQEMIAAMAEQRLWSSPNGKTPAQTLYAAIIREIKHKGAAARFIKTERGKFTAKAGA